MTSKRRGATLALRDTPKRRPPLARSGPAGLAAKVDADAAGIIARAQRVSACEQQIFAAIAPILARHRCKLGTVQEIVDGQPGPMRVVVVALD